MKRWLRIGWWLPLPNSNLFEGPGAWIYFRFRAWKESRGLCARARVLYIDRGRRGGPGPVLVVVRRPSKQGGGLG